MPTLLQIDSSPLYGRSVSRQLTGAFVSSMEVFPSRWNGVEPRP
jgi:FMN-dependent NADH-azoreductase